MKIVSQKFVIGLFLSIAIAHVLAVIYSWYWVYLWFDIPMHFIGGMWTASLFFLIFQMRNDTYLIKTAPWVSLLLVVGFAMTVGVLWEFVEFFFDVFIAENGSQLGFAQQGMADTMSDLFLDFLGGTVVWIFLFFRARKS